MNPSIHEKMLKSKILGMQNLPTLSATVVKLMKLLKDPNVKVPEVLDVLNRDPALCATMLKLVNSALYSPKTPVDTPERALVMLGMKKIHELVLSSSVMSIMSGREKQLWQHSFSTSMLLRAIVTDNQITASPDLELCGLLHDIGRIVIMSYSQTNERAIYQKTSEDLMPIAQAEVEILGCSHDRIGSWLLEHWQLPDSICVTVGHHHQPGLPESFVVESALLAMADYVDSRARHLPCRRPPPDLLAASGFGEVNVDDFISYQEELIQQLDATTMI